MARMYSGKRGSSGSTRPVSRRPPAWFKYEPEEVEDLVLKLSKEGNPPSIMCQILRDRYKLARLHKQASEKASLIREKASDDTILLASHFDADGISAGSIMLSAVNRLGSVPHLRIFDSVNERILDQIEAIESDLVIFTDIG